MSISICNAKKKALRNPTRTIIFATETKGCSHESHSKQRGLQIPILTASGLQIRWDGEEYIENGYLKIPMFRQTPSDIDIEVAGNYICYVFARRNDVVYVYNRSGVQAIIQTSTFISHTKFIKP